MGSLRSKDKTQRSTYIPGNSMIAPSLSQELEDTTLFNNTWTCSSTSRITLMRTSPTDKLLPTSSRSPRMPKLPSTTSITMVNSLIQLDSTHKRSTRPPGPTSSSESHEDV